MWRCEDKVIIYTFSDYVKWILYNLLSFTISFLIGQFGDVYLRRETFFHSVVIDFIIVYLLDMSDWLNFFSNSHLEYYHLIFTSSHLTIKNEGKFLYISVCLYVLAIVKTSLKVPKGQSKAVTLPLWANQYSLK
jgi:hypothetical protein